MSSATKSKSSRKTRKYFLLKKVVRTFLAFVSYIINKISDFINFVLKYRKSIIVGLIVIVFYVFVYVYGNTKEKDETYISKDYIIDKVLDVESFDKNKVKEVLRVKNEDDLKVLSQNFKDVENGNFIIVFDKEYWIYDMYKNIIKEKIAVNN